MAGPLGATMKRPSASLIARVVAAAAIGAVEPYIEVAWHCRAGFESSEACVWGKSLLPLARVVGLVVVAPLAFAMLSIVTWLWRSRSRRRGRLEPR